MLSQRAWSLRLNCAESCANSMGCQYQMRTNRMPPGLIGTCHRFPFRLHAQNFERFSSAPGRFNPHNFVESFVRTWIDS